MCKVSLRRCNFITIITVHNVMERMLLMGLSCYLYTVHVKASTGV